MPLGAGSIAFTGYNSDDPDALAFVALEEIPAGTVIVVTDNNWNGSAFAATEGTVTLTITTAIAAGTIVSLTDLNTGSPVSSTGTVVRSGSFNLTNSNEAVYAYTGTASSPTFLTAFANGTAGFTGNNTLTGTGLTAGATALDLSSVTRADIAAYNGSRTTATSFAGYRALLTDPANWISQGASGNQFNDAVAPDLPFSATAFTLNTNNPGSLSIAGATVTEGDPAGGVTTTAMTFTVTRSGGSTGAVSAAWGLAGLDGGAGHAFTNDLSGATSGTVSFADGQTSATIVVQVARDFAVEGTEVFSIGLHSPTGGVTIGTATATGTITDDDVAGTLSIADVSVTEGTGGSTTATITVTRTGGSGDLTVDYATATGTAAPADFTATSGQLSFTGGAQSASFTVAINPDAELEGDETFAVNLTFPTAGATLANSSATVTILDDDSGAPAGSVSIGDAQIVEGNAGTTLLQFTVTRTGGTGAFTIDYATLDGSGTNDAGATAGSDYVAQTGTLTFANGQTSATISIVVNGDIANELSEQFRIQLSNPSSTATITDGLALGTITTDDVLTTGSGGVWINEIHYDAIGSDVAGSEFIEVAGVAGTDLSEYSIVLYNGANSAVYATIPLTGTLPEQGGGYGTAVIRFGQDGVQNGSPDGVALVRTVGGVASLVEFLSYEGTFTGAGGAAAGVTSTDIGVIQSNSVAGTPARLGGAGSTSWTLAAESPGAFNPGQTIPAGTPALPTVSVSNASVNESAGTMTFVLTRSNVAPGAFTVDYATAAGTATAGTDFTATSGTVSFGANQATATVTVPIVNDATPELDETLVLNLSNAQGATIAGAQATGTIVNDDGEPIRVAINDVSIAEGDAGTTTMTFTVTRSGGTGAFSVDFASADGTATVAGGDYVATSGTLNFAAGETVKTISVTVNGDTASEPDETLRILLSNPTNAAVLTDGTGTGTIVNDELTFIHAIQGNSYFSPIVAGAGITGFGTGASTTVNATAFTVTVRAVVTAIDATGNRQGFYITEEAADWDSDNFTSEGIFVMTATDTAGVGTAVMTAIPGLAVGTIVTVTANVMEYRPFATNAPLTVLVNPVVTLGATGQPLPTLTLSGDHKIPNALLSGVAPDFTDSVDNPGDSFDATNYAMSFFETIEGMLVVVPDVRVADGFAQAQGGGTNFKVYSGASANPEQINSRGGYTIGGDPALSPPDTPSPLDNVIAGGKGVTDGDINPDILEIDFSDFAIPLSSTPLTTGTISMGDRLGDVTGIVEWNFTDMKLFPTAIGTVTDTNVVRETTTLTADARSLTFATFNVENLGGNAADQRFTDIAQAIATSLGSPDILSIEEIQDNNGATNDGTVDASVTWGKLVAALNAITGKVYQWVDQPPVNGADGGEPGGNIRVGFLYDTGRVQLGNLAADAPIEERRKYTDRLGDGVRDAGDLIAVSDNMISGISTADYLTTRKSLLAQFTFAGNTVFALANHLPSKGGSGTFWDASQQNVAAGTPANSDWQQRSNIGEDIYTLLNYVQTNVAGARILSGGDYNDFYFYRPLEAATGYVNADGTARNDGARLVNLLLSLPEAERYTYSFDGRSQAIDHILADAMTAAASTTDVVHINTGFADGNRLSDHDPVVTKVNFRGFGEVLNGTSAGETIDGGGGDDIIDGKGGADTLIGGTGNDIFYVDSLDDVVIENAGEGIDEVRTALASYVLPANVEKLTLLGTANGAQSVYDNAGDNALAGSAFGDFVSIAAGGTDSVAAGAGDDGIYAGGALDATDRIDGGAGTLDQLGLQGNYTTQLVLAADTIRNIDMLVFLAGSDTRFGASGLDSYSYNIRTNDGTVAAGQTLSIQANGLRAGENLTFDGSAETDGSFTFYAGFGSDVLTGGQRNDGFYFGQGRFTAGDRVDGQGGTMDQIGLQGDYAGANAIVFGAAQITGIEGIVLLSGADTRFGGGAARFSYTLTMNDANATGPGAMLIQANALRAGEVLILDAAAETATPYLVFGGADGDTITGGGGADTLWGLGGADTLRGGAGSDVFGYQAGDSTAAARDTILDFAAGDRIDLSRIGISQFVGTAAFVASGTGQVRVTSAGGGDWLVEGDGDGNGVADLAILVTAGSGYGWAAGDFALASPPPSTFITTPVMDSHALVL